MHLICIGKLDTSAHINPQIEEGAPNLEIIEIPYPDIANAW